jgi:hypothetical protein
MIDPMFRSDRRVTDCRLGTLLEASNAVHIWGMCADQIWRDDTSQSDRRMFHRYSLGCEGAPKGPESVPRAPLFFAES